MNILQRDGALAGVQLLRELAEAVGTCQTDTSKGMKHGHQQAACISRNSPQGVEKAAANWLDL